jgi:hypothetical protein
MKSGVNLFMTIMISAFLISGCSPQSRYERRVKHELESGVRYDSLFMGLYLGMPEKDFYLQCWKLNSKGMIRQGESNTTVFYELKNQLKYPAAMDFYPKFMQGKIFEMPVKFKYIGWAPWNKNLSSDKLQANIVKYYEKVYGRGFMEVKHPQHGSAFVKVDGNRRISIFTENDLYVWAVFTDLLAKKDSLNIIPNSTK